MKFFVSILALLSIFATAFAAPLTQTKEVSSYVTKGVSTYTGKEFSKQLQSPTKPKQFIHVFEQLLIEVKVHTGNINHTVDAYKAGDDKKVAGSAIIVELKVVVDVIRVVVNLLQQVKITLKFTLKEVQLIAACIVSIILEIVCTILNAIRCLGIQSLLSEVLKLLTVVLCDLLVIVGHLVGGVLKIVHTILSVPGLLAIVNKVLGGLTITLAKLL